MRELDLDEMIQTGGGLPDYGYQMGQYATNHIGEWVEGAVNFGAGFIHGFVAAF